MQSAFKTKFDEYYSLFIDYLNKFTNDLNKQIVKTGIAEPIVYSLQNGGKRLRPILCLACADLLCVDKNKVLRYALTLEMIHSYSLVHDDLPAMDNDDYRRGKLSTHKKFGEANAILTGDALLNLAIETLLSFDDVNQKDINAMKLMFDYSGYNGMIKGQYLDLKSENTKITDETLLYDIYLNKTCKLIMCATLIPSILKNNVFFDKLKVFGENIGYAFQIKDDILDIEGDFSKIGKTPNKDLSSDKLTAISVWGKEKAETKAEFHLQTAINALSGVNDSNFLVDFAEYLFKRNK